MASSQRRAADGVHVVLDGLAGGFFRGLEQRAHVDVEAEVGVGGGHHLGTPVMAVLAELGDHDARATAFFLGELGDIGLDLSPSFPDLDDAAVDTGDRLRCWRGSGRRRPFQRIGHLTDRGTQADGLDGQVEQVAFAGFGGCGQCVQRGFDGSLIARGPDCWQAGDLGFAHGVVVDIEDIDRRLPWPACTC